MLDAFKHGLHINADERASLLPPIELKAHTTRRSPSPYQTSLDAVERREQASLTIQRAWRNHLANGIEKSMLQRGSIWEDLKPGASIKEVSAYNLMSLRHEILAGGQFSKMEKQFFLAFTKFQFTAVHSSQHFNPEPDPPLELLSRQRLLKKKIDFPETNSKSCDLHEFATDDYVFASLNPSLTIFKPRSRFGAHTYQVELHDTNGNLTTRHERSFTSLQDMAKNYFPELSPSHSFTSATKADLDHLDDREHKILNGIFQGQDMAPGFALTIIRDARNLSPQMQDEILGALSLESLRDETAAKKLDTIINQMYRPELRVPGYLTAPSGEYNYFHRERSAHDADQADTMTSSFTTDTSDFSNFSVMNTSPIDWFKDAQEAENAELHDDSSSSSDSSDGIFQSHAQGQQSPQSERITIKGLMSQAMFDRMPNPFKQVEPHAAAPAAILNEDTFVFVDDDSHSAKTHKVDVLSDKQNNIPLSPTTLNAESLPKQLTAKPAKYITSWLASIPQEPKENTSWI